MPFLLGIDSGLTVTKAVVFDPSGHAVSVARRRVPHIMARPHHVERDMRTLWTITAEAIREAIGSAHIIPSDIAAVGVTAHGDGLYLIDGAGDPLRNGILSLDGRASALESHWKQDGTADRALTLSGQVPHASAPSSLAAWLRTHEPETYARIGTAFSCKDWLRYCLSGWIGTDLTEASTSFTNVSSQDYDPQILAIYQLDGLHAALPEIAEPDALVGHVTKDAAQACGLMAGTPIVAGLHDVTASALGVAGYAERTVAIVAGTYSINETVSTAPRTDARWFCRNGIRRGEWNNMSISPASAANYDWFLDSLMARDRADAGEDIHAIISKEIKAVAETPSDILFHPYLFGSPHGAVASGSFLGLRGWHGRGQVLRALIEGIAFNHRVHVESLRDAFPIETAHLTGGISRNPEFAQLFANALGMQVHVAGTAEAAAWGAALCAGSGVGLFDDPVSGARDTAKTGQVYAPDRSARRPMDALFDLHCDASKTLGPLWERLHNCGHQP